jgi:hypothetical protein
VNKKETIAEMTMILPNGKSYKYSYNFEEDYPEEAAWYMFFLGNFSCDCNRSLLLSMQYDDVQEMICGEKIKIEDFSLL